MTILIAIQDESPEKWSVPLQSELPQHVIKILQQNEPLTSINTESIRYVLAWQTPMSVIKSIPNLEIVFSLGAGVDHLISDPEFPNSPIVRFVSPDLTMRMGEWVLLQVLFHFRQQSNYLRDQAIYKWNPRKQPAASDVCVGILGLGVLGSHVAKLLLEIGFQVAGWSRTPKSVDGVSALSGNNSLPEFLSQVDILVNLLPYTPQTHGILNLDVFRQLRGNPSIGGAIFINAGRGKSHVENDILYALDKGILAGVSLDVFETEPLPESSPLWVHPKIVVTPHVAADSDSKEFAMYVADQIKKFENGFGLDNVVDRNRGY